MTVYKLKLFNDVDQSYLIKLLTPLLLASLSSCDKSYPTSIQNQENPVLVVVGGSKITQSELNSELTTLGTQPAGNVNPALDHQILEALIDRDIVAREALRRNIDRDPDVSNAIERAREKILVQAYLQELIATSEKPAPQQIDQYYNAHHAIYAERKLFKSDELVIASDKSQPTMRAMIDAGVTMRQMLAWLDAHEIAYSYRHRFVTGDKLPAAIAEDHHAFANGKLFIVEDGQDFQAWSMNVVGQQPLSEDAAKEQIVNELTYRDAMKKMAGEVGKLRIEEGVTYRESVPSTVHGESMTANNSVIANNVSAHGTRISIAQESRK